MARTLHRLPRCFAFVQILQHQPELLDLNVELLRRRPELHAPQLVTPGLYCSIGSRAPVSSASPSSASRARPARREAQRSFELGRQHPTSNASLPMQRADAAPPCPKCQYAAVLSLPRPTPPKCGAARASRSPAAPTIALRSAPPTRSSPVAKETRHAPAAWQ